MSSSADFDTFSALSPARRPRAIVYCEANFGAIDGKTANGLVRHSERYEILSVIDSVLAGHDAGMALDGVPNGIPVCRDLEEALHLAGERPELFIVGVAPTSGLLSSAERDVLFEATPKVEDPGQKGSDQSPACVGRIVETDIERNVVAVACHELHRALGTG